MWQIRRSHGVVRRLRAAVVSSDRTILPSAEFEHTSNQAIRAVCSLEIKNLRREIAVEAAARVSHLAHAEKRT
jgi:hypothetical protein